MCGMLVKLLTPFIFAADVSLGYAPPSGGFHYNKLSNLGKKFVVCVSYVGGTWFNEETYDLLVMLQTYSPSDQQIKVVSKRVLFHKEYPIRTVYISKGQLRFYNIKELSILPSEGHKWYYMMFFFESDEEFQLTALIQKNRMRIKSYLVLPMEYWDTEYYYFNILGDNLFWWVSTRHYNNFYLWCNKEQKYYHRPVLMLLEFRLILACRNIKGDPSTRGVWIKSKHPVGMIVHEISSRLGDLYCDDMNNTVGQDVIPPRAMLGTEFVTVFNEAPKFRTSLLILTVFNVTEVKVYTSEGKYESHVQQGSLQVFELLVERGGRRVMSDQPILVQAVMRPICGASEDAMFDFSATYLVPEHLYYNDYLVGHPNITNVTSIAKIIISTSGLDYLTNNDHLIKRQTDWRNVAGKANWTIGQTDISPGISNRIRSVVSFACYVFTFGQRKSDVPPAGYRTCGSDSYLEDKTLCQPVWGRKTRSNGSCSIYSLPVTLLNVLLLYIIKH